MEEMKNYTDDYMAKMWEMNKFNNETEFEKSKCTTAAKLAKACCEDMVVR